MNKEILTEETLLRFGFRLHKKHEIAIDYKRHDGLIIRYKTDIQKYLVSVWSQSDNAQIIWLDTVGDLKALYQLINHRELLEVVSASAGNGA